MAAHDAPATATASSSNSALASMVSDPGVLITITQDEFNMFHSIDRRLFFRLVMNLCRDPVQSMQVMALLMWLEKTSKNCRMMDSLLTWSDQMLNDLVNEVVMALTCIESENFPFPDAMSDMPLTQKLTHSGVNFMFIHENRHSIIPAMAKCHSDICIRAFSDIITKVQHEKALTENASLEKMKMIQEQNLNLPPAIPAGQHLFRMGPPLPMGYNREFLIGPRVAVAGVVPQHHVVGMAAQLMGTQAQVNTEACDWCAIEKFDIDHHRDFLNDELNQFLGAMHLNGDDDNAAEASEVHPDDRTIFVTFSKGYPISESEVLDFFTRRYGDIIEAIHMQEVSPLEQPLYARLVVRSAAVHMIEVVLEGAKRNKFNINGKHVWARKYVPKNKQPPQVGSPGTSQPDSPATDSPATYN